MFFIFIFYWIIAILIYINKNRTKFDCWAASTFFLFGFGAISVILREQADLGNLSWLFPAVAASLGMLWGPYALLMSALHFSGKVSQEKRKQLITAILAALPIIIFYFAVPALKMFGHEEPQAAQDIHTCIMTLMLAPYYLGSAGLIVWKIICGNKSANRTEDITTFYIAVPPPIGILRLCLYFALLRALERLESRCRNYIGGIITLCNFCCSQKCFWIKF